MLLSMTGYGAARRQLGTRMVSVEIRAVNNRYLKCSMRLPEGLTAWEPRIERHLREAIARGTVSVTVRLDDSSGDVRQDVNSPLLRKVARQAGEVAASLELPTPGIEGLLLIPGMIVERSASDEEYEPLRPILLEALEESLAGLNEFRRAEGAAMAAELRANLRRIEEEVDEIACMGPNVIRNWRDRLLKRVRELLAESEVPIEENDLIREVSVFADRCDINEELTRLRSHVAQFRAFLDGETSQGRKLDFLTQELNREINTVGSKANDVSIAHRVVEVKTAVEKIREILQNVE